METVDRDDHRIQIEIGKHVSILPMGPGAAMMKTIRHPDDRIYLNTQITDLSRGLAKSADGGHTWTQMPLKSPNAPPCQHAAGFGISHDGRLWIARQAPGANEAQETGSIVKCPGCSYLSQRTMVKPGRQRKLTLADWSTFTELGVGLKIMQNGKQIKFSYDEAAKNRTVSEFVLDTQNASAYNDKLSQTNLPQHGWIERPISRMVFEFANHAELCSSVDQPNVLISYVYVT